MLNRRERDSAGFILNFSSYLNIFNKSLDIKENAQTCSDPRKLPDFSMGRHNIVLFKFSMLGRREGVGHSTRFLHYHLTSSRRGGTLLEPLSIDFDEKRALATLTATLSPTDQVKRSLQILQLLVTQTHRPAKTEAANFTASRHQNPQTR